MSLLLCQRCQQHYTQGNTCPHCVSNPTKGILPLALLLGIGCHKTEPRPEVMALYGGPPIEEPEMEDGTNEAPATENQTEPTEAKKGSAEDTDQATQATEDIQPKPTIKALYGLSPVEVKEMKIAPPAPTDKNDEDNDSPPDSESTDTDTP